MNYSRQREAIKQNLWERHDHPTADMIYQDVKKIYPDISLGTVYRNLTLLVETGEIVRLHSGNGPEHFDGDTKPHYHYICNECGKVKDIFTKAAIDFGGILPSEFDEEIEAFAIQFSGVCRECRRKVD